MKYILVVINYLILSVSTLSTNLFVKPKLCIDCKFFTKEFFIADKFGKCLAFPREQRNEDYINFLVDGSKITRKIGYNYCSVARNSEIMCGKEGKLYEENKK